MNIHQVRKAFWLVMVIACGGCGGAAASPQAPTGVSTHEQYVVEACGAWDALFTAVGNPDTGTGSELSRSLDRAVAGHDGAAADRLASAIVSELRSGRRHASAAGGWPPRTAVMAHLDRVFAAFEVMTIAKVAQAKGQSEALDPQAAFEQAGGIDAWLAMLEAYRAAGPASPSAPQCPKAPVTP
jgi:hypothetical protein